MHVRIGGGEKKKKKKKSKESDERAVVQVKSNIKTSFENLPREGELKRSPCLLSVVCL